jgi:penicillin-binding protein 1A
LDLSGLTAAALTTEEGFAAAVGRVKPAPSLRLGARITAIDLKAGKRKRGKVADLDFGGGYSGSLDLSERAWQKPLPGSMPKIWGKRQRPYAWLSVGDVVYVELRGIEAKSLTSILIQKPLVQGALVAVDPRSREVVAMVGGYDFRVSPFNRAVQGRRQPGSAFKPIVYAAGLQSRRFTPATMISDAPKVFHDASQKTSWKAENYEDSFEGDISMRHCLTYSKNTCSIQIAESIGAANIISLARALGIESRLPTDLTISLGSGEVLPIELTNAFATLAAGGRFAPPVFLGRVQDRHGEKLFESKTRLRQVISPAVAYLITNLMESVVQSGTARSLLPLRRALAAKTGTTNEQRSAWLVGFTPELACGIYIGFDNNDPLGRAMTGGGVAAPVWLDFMKIALADVPKSKFSVPPGITFAYIDPKTGLLAADFATDGRRETFLTGTVPREVAPLDMAGGSSGFEEEY